MPSSILPSAVKALINSLTGAMCERMSKLFQFTTFLHTLVSYLFNESGLPSDEFKADLCEALSDCIGTGGGTEPPNPSMPAPLHLIASDDAFSDKIRITWDAVTAPDGIDAVTSYKLYRGTTTSFGSAALIATITAPTVTYDDPVDGDLSAGTNYHYWVRASNGTDVSAVSNRDQGRAATSGELGVLDAIADLACTQGFSANDAAAISLVWTPPAGATKYDVWRHTANLFSAATKIASNMVPEDPESNILATTTPDQMWDNDGEIVMFHFPPSATVHYYFWVVAKGDSPPSISTESNEAIGWVRSFYSPFLEPTPLTLTQGQSITEGVDFDAVTARVVLFAGGGGGAGGSQVYGGGGGGAGGVVVEIFTIAPGDVLSLEATDSADDTGNAAALSDGTDGPTMNFKINGVTKMSADGGGGGLFDAAGGGAGGVLNGASGTTSPTIYTAHAGKPGVGPAGGATGYRFGDRRYPPAWFNGFTGWDGNAPSYAVPGGGSKAAPGVEVLAVGGKGKAGIAILVFGT